MEIELETTDNIILRCRCGSTFQLSWREDPEPPERDCSSCYHQLPGYLCACRDPEDMVTHDCLDWSPR